MAEYSHHSDIQIEQPCRLDMNKKMRYRLWECQRRGEFCDVILETDGGDLVLAHRVIVASSSPVLHSMLLDHNICDKDEQSGMLTLKLPEISKDSLQDLVRFSYVGDVEEIRVETASIWERFQIYEPINLCVEAPNIKGTRDQEISFTTTTKPVDIVPEIKNEPGCVSVREDEDDIEDLDEGNDFDFEETNTKLRKSTSQQPTLDEMKNKAMGIESSSSVSRSQRRRKCSSPKQLKIKQEIPYDDDSSEDNVPIKTLLEREGNLSEQNELSDYMDADTDIDEEYMPNPKKAKKRKATTMKEDMLKKEKKPPKAINKAPTRCEACNVGFGNAEDYQEHKQTMHNKGHHKCMECGLSFTKLNRLKAHRIRKHPQEGLPQPMWYHCKAEGCTYKSIYRDVLDQHYKSIHAKERCICETCGAEFSRKYVLTLHIKRAHKGRGKMHNCDECEASFCLPCELKRHKERVHRKSKPFLCDKCPFSTFDNNSIVIHMFLKHNTPLPGKRNAYTCPYCDYKSYTKAIMTAHVERHGDETFKCDLCDSEFQCNRDLKSHHRLRHSKKPKTTHPCPYEGCDYVSIYGPGRLEQHVGRMHENKDHKPFGCDMCSYRTNLRGNLNLHIRKVHKVQPQILQHRVQKYKTTEKQNPPATSTQDLLQHTTSDDPNPAPNFNLAADPGSDLRPTQESFLVYPSTTYQDISESESAPVEDASTYQMLSTAETMPNKPPAETPAIPSAQFRLKIPNVVYEDEPL